jgi:1-acyl-sn-glycerol-3-phosphate acyltransferase
MLHLSRIACGFAITSVLLVPLQALSIVMKWPIARWIPSLYFRILCRLMGVQIHVVGQRVVCHPLLIVSNHVSWLDIPVISSVAPVVFVAKQDIAHLPVFGALAKLGRSIFVDRRRRSHVKVVNHKIAQSLLEGDPVVLFAEGTSTDGNVVLPFRSALIGSVGQAIAVGGRDHKEICVQPLSITYVGDNRDSIALYGTMDLHRHVMQVLRNGNINVVLTWGEPIMHTERFDRKEMAKSLEATVRRLTFSTQKAGLELENRSSVPQCFDGIGH